MYSSEIVKYIENHIDELFIITYESDIDEYGDKYSVVYKYELQEFKQELEYTLNFLEDKIVLDEETIRNQIMLKWFDETVFNEGVIIKLNKFVSTMLKEIYNKETSKVELNLESDEQEEIKKLISDKIYSLGKLLVESTLEEFAEYKFIQFVEKTKGKEASKNIIDKRLNSFILLVNSYYKLYGTKPNTDYLEMVIRAYKIDRNKFAF